MNDNNSIEDIQGAIYCLQTDIQVDAPEFPVDEQFLDLIERIEAKLARTRNRTRRNWFTEALDQARNGHQQFKNGHIGEVELALQKCLDGISDGNKAHRRKTTFVVGPDGTTTKVQEK